MISNCCGASIVPESIDVCSDCKEHCDVVSEAEYFDEVMKVQGKDVIYNGKLIKDGK